MKVKNDFPNVDSVLRKLKAFNNFFREKKRNCQDEILLEDCKDCEELVKDFVDAIERYLDSACNADNRIQRVKDLTNDPEQIQAATEIEDNLRTGYHSRIITNMIMIDRYADIYKLDRVFDYAEEFDKSFAPLVPTSREEKKNMTERERIKRREMGNFGLYIAAAVTAGVSREAAEITDDDLREFADCEGDKVKINTGIFAKVKHNSHGLKKNVDTMFEDNPPGGLT